MTTNKVKELVERIEEGMSNSAVYTYPNDILLQDCKAELERLEAKNARYKDAYQSIANIQKCNYPQISVDDVIHIIDEAVNILKQPEGGLV